MGRSVQWPLARARLGRARFHRAAALSALPLSAARLHSPHYGLNLFGGAADFSCLPGLSLAFCTFTGTCLAPATTLTVARLHSPRKGSGQVSLWPQ